MRSSAAVSVIEITNRPGVIEVPLAPPLTLIRSHELETRTSQSRSRISLKPHDIAPREVTVRLFSEAQDQLFRTENSPKTQVGAFSQIRAEAGRPQLAIEEAAHQVLSPVFKAIIDDPKRYAGMMVRVDVAQHHPHADLNISPPPKIKFVPSPPTDALLGKLHGDLTEYIVSRVLQKIDPCMLCPGFS